MKDADGFLQAALAQQGIPLEPPVQARLLQYLEMLFRWNKTFNLTAICDWQQAIWLHLVDSLLILPWLPGKRLLDVGTGAGLPGIPLALARPDCQFVLLDSNGKKTRFLEQLRLDLEIDNIEVVQSRAGGYHPETGFDGILTRAFASLPVMLAETLHLAGQTGQFLAMKGACPAKEIEDLPEGFSVVVHRLDMKGVSAERHLVCIRRNSP